MFYTFCDMENTKYPRSFQLDFFIKKKYILNMLYLYYTFIEKRRFLSGNIFLHVLWHGETANAKKTSLGTLIQPVDEFYLLLNLFSFFKRCLIRSDMNLDFDVFFLGSPLGVLGPILTKKLNNLLTTGPIIDLKVSLNRNYQILVSFHGLMTWTLDSICF